MPCRWEFRCPSSQQVIFLHPVPAASGCRPSSPLGQPHQPASPPLPLFGVQHPRSPHPDVFRVSNDRLEGCTGRLRGSAGQGSACGLPAVCSRCRRCRPVHIIPARRLWSLLPTSSYHSRLVALRCRHCRPTHGITALCCLPRCRPTHIIAAGCLLVAAGQLISQQLGAFWLLPPPANS